MGSTCCASFLSEVEGDGRCAAEGGHVVGGNNVAAFDAERKNSLRGDHRNDVDAARNRVGKADDLARVGEEGERRSEGYPGSGVAHARCGV